MTEPPGAGNTGDQPAAAPSYTSPSDQFRETLAKMGIPFVGLPGFFENLSKASSGSSGGRFEFSLDEMRSLHAQFRAEADAFEQMYEKAQDAADKISPLAGDPASQGHHKTAQNHFNQQFLPAIRQQFKFALGFEEAVKAAIDERENAEQAGTADMNSTGSAL